MIGASGAVQALLRCGRPAWPSPQPSPPPPLSGPPRKLPPSSTGDDARDDVGGALAAGMRGVLVRTGKYRPGDEGGAGAAPTATVPDFPAAVDWVLAQNAAAARS